MTWVLRADLRDRLNVSRETEGRLAVLYDMVLRWNPTVNLISKKSVEGGWSRHVEDSAQILVAAQPASGKWLDLGSGGGFPGLVIAVLTRDVGLELKVTLVESDQRKAAFLLEACRVLDLKTEVLPFRIEDLPDQKADTISARALGSLDSLLEHAFVHLHPAGRCFFLKGKQVHTEIEAAKRNWRFESTCHKGSIVDGGVILEVSGVNRA